MTNTSNLIEKTQNSWLILVTLGLFWPKFVNLNPWLGYSRVNNFLDLVVSSGHLLVLFIVIIELFRLRQHYTILCLSLLTISVWQINLANPSLEELARAVFTWGNLSVWLAIWFRYQHWFKFFWSQILVIIWLFYAAFEHLLLSNPYPVLLVWLVWSILTELKLGAAHIENDIPSKQSIFYQLTTVKPQLVIDNQSLQTQPNQLFFLIESVNRDLLIKPKNLATTHIFTNVSGKLLNLSKTPQQTANSQLKNWLVNPIKLIFSAKKQWPRFWVLGSSLSNLVAQIKLWRPSEITLFLISLWLTQNLLLASWQVITGTSFGLSILGEPVVSLHTTIAAKQPIGDYYLVVLRGYGLMQHPNILGFLGVTGLWLSLANNHSTTYRLSKLQFYLRIISIAIIFLSFSRLAWLSGLFILVSRLIQKKVTTATSFSKVVTEYLKTSWLWLFGLTGLMTIIFFSRLAYSHSTDWVRLREYIYFWSTYSQLPWSQKLFGVGLGQYPFYFRSYHSWLTAETYQPMHNLFASLFVELGIVFSSLLFVYLYLFTKQNQLSSNK